jgi:Yip1 domain
MTAATDVVGASGSGAAPGAPKSLPARVIGVLVAPRATYADVAARPRWLGVLAFIVILGAAGTFVFLSTDVGRNAMIDQQIETMRSFGVQMNDAAISRLEQGADRGKYFGPIFQAITLPLAGLLISAIAFAVFNAVLGGDARFKQVFAVVAHSGVVVCLSQMFGLPLAYAREKMTSTTNLAVFAPFLDENSFPARLLGAIDLFLIWWIVSLAIGLGILYRKRTAPIATTLIVIYVALGVIIAAIKTAASGA